MRMLTETSKALIFLLYIILVILFVRLLSIYFIWDIIAYTLLIALPLAVVYRRAGRQKRQIQALFSASTVLVSSLCPEEIAKESLKIVRQLLRFDFADIWLLNEENNSLSLFASNIDIPIPKEIPIDYCVPGMVMSTGKAVYIEDSVNSPLLKDIQWLQTLKHASEAHIPLVYKGQTIGVLILASLKRQSFAQEKREILEIFTNQLALAISLARLYSEVERQSITDALTGLYNYRYFAIAAEKEIKNANRYQVSFTLVLLDIDDLKIVNDTYGHLFGDRIIQEFADALKASARESDLVFRYGGDEFTVILPHTEEDGAAHFVSRVKECLAGNTWLSFSYGFAVYPRQVASYEDLVKTADKNMYKQKLLNKRKERDL